MLLYLICRIPAGVVGFDCDDIRSEERRVGKECYS